MLRAERVGRIPSADRRFNSAVPEASDRNARYIFFSPDTCCSEASIPIYWRFEVSEPKSRLPKPEQKSRTRALSPEKLCINALAAVGRKFATLPPE